MGKNMTIIGIFFNIEISTGGHIRYLKLLQDLAEKGCAVVLYHNGRLDLELPGVTLVPVDVFYIRHKTKNLSSLFARRLDAFLKSRGGEPGPSPDPGKDGGKHILVFGETHWKAAKVLSKTTGAGILFAQRSDSVSESLMYLRHERLAPKDRIFNILYIARQRLREKDIAKNAEVAFFQSRRDADSFLRRTGGSRARVAVVRGNIKTDRFKPEYANANTSARCRDILFIGTLGMRKGVAYLLEAAARLHREGLPFSLKIFGPGSDGDKNRVLGFIARNGLTEAVSVYGRTEDPFAEMAKADLFVVPSLFDSYPDTILEAIHCGLPVVASSCGGIPDMLRHPELLFPPADAEAIHRTLRALITDDGAYLRCRELCASRRAYFDFDWAQAWLDEITRPQ